MIFSYLTTKNLRPRIWFNSISLIVLMTVLSISSCKEFPESDKGLGGPQISFISVSKSDTPEIRKQLAWICKGLVLEGVYTQNYKTKVHDIIESTSWFGLTHSLLHDEVATIMSHDYEGGVDGAINSKYPNNDYNDDYFFNIDIDQCYGDVMLWIPEADDIDQSKLHVVTPMDPFKDEEETWGFFYDSTNSQIDSIIIDEDNMDSVYLWVISIDETCPTTGIISPRTFSDGGCDQDGHCEPWKNEDFSNCTDCQQTPVGPNKFTLNVKSITFGVDKKGFGGTPGENYQESHLDGKYELIIGFGIWPNFPLAVPPLNNPAKEFLMRSWRMSSSLLTEHLLLGEYSAWGKDCDIKRTKKKNNGSTKSNRGRTWTENKIRRLANDYDPAEDDLAFYVLEEDHDRHSNLESFITKDHNGDVVTGQHIGSLATKEHPYSFVENQNASVPEFSDQIILIPGTSPLDFTNDPQTVGVWNKVSTGVYEAFFPMDGEVGITLQIKRNN